MDPEAKKEFKRVEDILGEIRKNTAYPWWRSLWSGLFYGAGWVVGTVGAIAALGWLLALFGIIPGFDTIAARLQEIMNAQF